METYTTEYKNEATIIQLPTTMPRIPNFPCLGAILARSSSARTRAAWLLDKSNLFIKPDPNIKPKAADTRLPAKNVAHQIGEVLNHPKLRTAVKRPQTPQKQNIIPIYPW